MGKIDAKPEKGPQTISDKEKRTQILIEFGYGFLLREPKRAN